MEARKLYAANIGDYERNDYGISWILFENPAMTALNKA